MGLSGETIRKLDALPQPIPSTGRVLGVGDTLAIIYFNFPLSASFGIPFLSMNPPYLFVCSFIHSFTYFPSIHDSGHHMGIGENGKVVSPGGMKNVQMASILFPGCQVNKTNKYHQ